MKQLSSPLKSQVRSQNQSRVRFWGLLPSIFTESNQVVLKTHLKGKIHTILRSTCRTTVPIWSTEGRFLQNRKRLKDEAFLKGMFDFCNNA